MKCVLLLIIGFALGSSCTPTPPGTTTGTFTMVADRSMRPVLEELLQVYRSQYPLVTADITYCSAGDVMVLFGVGTATLALYDQTPDSLSLLWYQRRNIGVESYPIAQENWFWMHHKNTKPTPTQQLLIKDAKGSDALWLESSGVLTTAPSLIPAQTSLSEALASCTLCVALVGEAEYKGLVRSSLPPYIVRSPVLDDAGKPASRVWYVLNGEPRIGPGSGFVAFLRGVRGQKIIAKAGINPAIPIERLIYLRGDNLVFSPSIVHP